MLFQWFFLSAFFSNFIVLFRVIAMFYVFIVVFVLFLCFNFMLLFFLHFPLCIWCVFHPFFIMLCSSFVSPCVPFVFLVFFFPTSSFFLRSFAFPSDLFHCIWLFPSWFLLFFLYLCVCFMFISFNFLLCFMFCSFMFGFMFFFQSLLFVSFILIVFRHL